MSATLRVCIRAGTDGEDGGQRRKEKEDHFHIVLGIWCASEAALLSLIVPDSALNARSHFQHGTWAPRKAP